MSVNDLSMLKRPQVNLIRFIDSKISKKNFEKSELKQSSKVCTIYLYKNVDKHRNNRHCLTIFPFIIKYVQYTSFAIIMIFLIYKIVILL